MVKPEQIYNIFNGYGSNFILHNMSVVSVQHAE